MTRYVLLILSFTTFALISCSIKTFNQEEIYTSPKLQRLIYDRILDLFLEERVESQVLITKDYSDLHIHKYLVAPQGKVLTNSDLCYKMYNMTTGELNPVPDPDWQSAPFLGYLVYNPKAALQTDSLLLISTIRTNVQASTKLYFSKLFKQDSFMHTQLKVVSDSGTELYFCRILKKQFKFDDIEFYSLDKWTEVVLKEDIMRFDPNID